MDNKDDKKASSKTQTFPKEKPEKRTEASDSERSNPDSPLQRFAKSMKIDYEKWHDGIGYDLNAIKLASPTERKEIEQMLIQHRPRDWRDIEALAEIDSEDAKKTIRNSVKDPNFEVQVAVARYSPNLIKNKERTHSIVEALAHAELYGCLSQVLDEIEDYHPKEVEKALITGLMNREGEAAVLFAAMLFYLHGKAKEPFDMNQRSFFLRFNTENRKERILVFRELCKQLNINPEQYLKLR